VRRRYLTRRSFESDHLALAAAWRDYQKVRRSLWVRAVFVERRYLRTQDHTSYQAEHRAMTQARDGAVRAWKAACRRFNRGAVVLPVGQSRHGLPLCFLVRVPKRKSLAVDEHVFGAVPKADIVGREFFEQLRSLDTKERQGALQRSRESALYAKLVKYLTAARTLAALKERELYARSQVERSDPRWTTHTQRAYKAQKFHGRQWARVLKYKKRLLELGLVYDIAHIDTTVVLPA
jgi:hypothetical protein